MDHFWTFRSRFAWQAQGIVHLVKSEQNVRVLWHFQKRWQAWCIWRGSAKMHFPWQAQYKRHLHRSCWEVRALISGEGLHFGASDLQVCWDDFAWQVQHFVWPGITCSWQVQYFRQVDWKNRKTHWYEAVSSALNFPCLKEVSQNCFAFDVVKFKNWRSLADLLRFGCCPAQKMKKSRKIASFLMLSTSKNEEILQNSFVFKLADRQIDRQTDTQTER